VTRRACRSFLTWTASIERKPLLAIFNGLLRGASILQATRGFPFCIRAAARGLLSKAALHDHSEDDTMTPTRGRIESLVMQIQTAFLENSMLSLTLPAAQRRFGLDGVTCAGVLGALVEARVLTEREGAYRRYVPGPAVRRAA
jgi:hypothetical protein